MGSQNSTIWQMAELPRGKRKAGSDFQPEIENIFSELEKGKSVTFCLEAADGPDIPILSSHSVGHRPF